MYSFQKKFYNSVLVEVEGSSPTYS